MQVDHILHINVCPKYTCAMRNLSEPEHMYMRRCAPIGTQCHARGGRDASHPLANIISSFLKSPFYSNIAAKNDQYE